MESSPGDKRASIVVFKASGARWGAGAQKDEKRRPEMKKTFKTRSVLMAMLLSLFVVASTFGTAFAAPGDIVGLTDFATIGSPRTDSYAIDYPNTVTSYTLQIVRIQEISSDLFIPIGFDTAAEALAVTWSHNTPQLQNGVIGSATAVLSADINGYYLSVAATNRARSLGPDSWRATDPATGATGDFSFVGTAYNNPDSGNVNGISIEFYDGNPTASSVFASGAFDSVNGSDDYDSIIGDHGRSYPTPLDAVAHGTYYPNIITTYHKYTLTQSLRDIVDVSGSTHEPANDGEGWLYAVYYPGSDNVYNRDAVSEYAAYDDYLLRDKALVIFAIGNYDDYGEYHLYFPDVIHRP
jgi:hypothetical protein